MKCTDCGAAVRMERVTRAYSDLPDVVVDGVERGTCASCGATYDGFPRWDELGKIIADQLINKPSRLTPAEVRFLRHSIAMKGQDLAAVLGVKPVQVSRWENGAQPISALADRLLRMVVARHEGLAGPDLRAIDSRASEPLALRLDLTKRGWRVVNDRVKAA